jgi:hypothetical protein
MGSIVLLDLMGGVALLLWGLHMVRSGIMRAFGSELRSILSTALSNRFLALLAGIGVPALLQSSTATGLLMTSFAARGLVNLVPALAVALLLAEPCPGACLRQGCHRPRRAAAVATSEDGTPYGAETTMGCIAGNRLGASAVAAG